MIDEAYAEYMANCRRFMRTINAHQVMDFGRSKTMEKDREQKILEKIDFEEKRLTEEFAKSYISLADVKTALNEIRQEVKQ